MVVRIYWQIEGNDFIQFTGCFQRPTICMWILTVCSVQLESYWTYEVCHGKHVRQYHEEKETGQVGSQQEALFWMHDWHWWWWSLKEEIERERKDNKRSKMCGVCEVPRLLTFFCFVQKTNIQEYYLGTMAKTGMCNLEPKSCNADWLCAYLV